MEGSYIIAFHFFICEISGEQPFSKGPGAFGGGKLTPTQLRVQIALDFVRIPDAKLPDNRRAVHFDGPHRDPSALTDLAVRELLPDQFRDFALAVRELLNLRPDRAFGFYRHGVMEAPVHFKRTGIEELIVKNANEHLGAIWNEEYSISADELPLYSDFRMPVYGGAVYHESNLRLGRWRLTAGIRFDVEHTSLAYHSRTDMDYFVSKEGGAPAPKRISIDEGNRIAHTYCEVLPKVSLLYAFDEVRNLYISVAKGYKAGGFNTQMFSDILSEKLKWRMAGSQYDEADLMSYEPEYSWNYELGGHFSCMDGAVRGDFAVFYIDVRDQQLTIFPEGQSTGRMMTNAGRTRSVGAEAALQFAPWRSLEINTAYGYTDARFVRYDNGIEDFKDNRIPYAPQHTLSAQAAWTLPTGVKWLGDVVLQAGVRCAGRIWWNEENTLSQPFYALADASVRFEHKHYSLDIWGRNLGGARYDVFYFKSIGNEFVQRGRPRTFGITLNINI